MHLIPIFQNRTRWVKANIISITQLLPFTSIQLSPLLAPVIPVELNLLPSIKPPIVPSLASIHSAVQFGPMYFLNNI